ncbi:MAG: FAD-dependent oxidoreductase [Elusimicrobia bacterium]|nr:FAD-dependent oxidoreductase [Elusimicrobiota bacterium]
MTETSSLAALVSHIADEGPDARLLRLELPEGRSLEWRPGQFVEVTLPGSGLPGRAFSIANAPQDCAAVEILFDRRGPLAEQLFRLKGGEPLLVRGPMGKWSYRDEDRRAALFSSGTGIAPLRAIVRYALAKGLPNRLDLFYAAPTPGKLLLRRELEEAAEKGVGVHLSVTEPEGMWEEGLWWDGARGPVTSEAMRSALGPLEDVVFYMCGGGRMIEALRAGLLAAGARADSFRVEKWGDY